MRHPQVTMDGRKTASSHSADVDNSEKLLRLLVGHLCPPKLGQLQSPTIPWAEADEIVLDVELDGYRYLLVRSVKSSRAQVELSPREKEIVRMVAQGYPNKTIAGVLNISSWTVCTHLRRVFAKLGVGSRAAMVARVHDMGTIRTAPRMGYAANANSNSVNEVRKDDAKRPAELTSRMENVRPTRHRTA
jgi:DNA-binding CsgD family transcriptional regulator